MESKKVKEVVIDTYILLAIVYDEVGENASRVLEDIRDRPICNPYIG